MLSFQHNVLYGLRKETYQIGCNELVYLLNKLIHNKTGNERIQCNIYLTVFLSKTKHLVNLVNNL